MECAEKEGEGRFGVELGDVEDCGGGRSCVLVRQLPFSLLLDWMREEGWVGEGGCDMIDVPCNGVVSFDLEALSGAGGDMLP